MSKHVDADGLLNGAYVYVSSQEIKDFPAADVVEVKHGHWKPFDLTWGRSVYACTACGEAFEVPTEKGKSMYKWCPFCGALMDEVEECQQETK